MRKTLAIEIRDLPLRARQLDSDELEAVFGGCKKLGKKCKDDSECCGKKICEGSSRMGYKCFHGAN